MGNALQQPNVQPSLGGRRNAPPAPPRSTSGVASGAPAWERALLALPDSNPEVEKLRASSLRFLRGEWLPVCLAAGWDDIELWGAYPAERIAVAKRRGDCFGLVPALVLGLSCTVEDIDPHRAIVSRRKTGARLSHRRQLPGRAHAVPWWEAPFATRGADEFETEGFHDDRT